MDLCCLILEFNKILSIDTYSEIIPGIRSERGSYVVAFYIQEGSPSDSFDVILQQTNSYSFRTHQKVENQKAYLLVREFFFSLSWRVFVIHTVGTHAGARVLINSIRQR